MGSLIFMSEDQINDWKQRILVCYNKWREYGDMQSLQLFLVWLYEFAESIAATVYKKNANVKWVKEHFGERDNFIIHLFHLRGKIIHSPYLADEEKISEFYNKSENYIIEFMNDLHIIIGESDNNRKFNKLSIF